MSYESTANDLIKSTAAASPNPAAPAKSAPVQVERTVLDEFKAQLRALELAQSRVQFMIREIQGLIRK
jgi:hypothetical protein